MRAAFRFAALHRLPLLFVVANRVGARSPQALDLRSLYPEFGMHVFTVDANDAIAAYRVTTEAMHFSRQRRGPSILEALSVPAPPNGEAHTPLQLLAAYMRRHGCPAL
jgi:TPP-dependent pyruvate/acetoin dehydrogenase alpha subunit